MDKIRLYLEETSGVEGHVCRSWIRREDDVWSSPSMFESKADMFRYCVESFGTTLLDAPALEVVSTRELRSELFTAYKRAYSTPAELHLGVMGMANVPTFAWLLKLPNNERGRFSELFERSHQVARNCAHTFGYDLFDPELYSITANDEMYSMLCGEWSYLFPEGFRVAN